MWKRVLHFKIIKIIIVFHINILNLNNYIIDSIEPKHVQQ